MKKSPRLVIYPTDIATLTDRSIRHSRETLELIRRRKGKDKEQPITVHDLAEFMGLDVEVIRDALHS